MHFRLRIPEQLKQEIEEAAAGNNRSMTAEIIARLGEYNDLAKMERALLKRLDEVKEERDLAASRVATDHELTKSLRQTVKTLDAALKAEQRITDQLISLLRTRLGATDVEIATATKTADK